MSNKENNAITRRLELLYQQWEAFVELPQARLMRWLVDRDEARVVATLVALENHEEGGRLPHLFVELDLPFVEAEGYGFAMVEALSEQFEEGKESLAKDGFETGWTAPAPQSGESSLPLLLRTCRSLQQYYAEFIKVLVLVLQPSRVTDHQKWARWLRRTADHTPWPSLRMMVCDAVDRPLLDRVDRGSPKVVVSRAAGLDMAGALEELSNEAGGLDQPHGMFRQHHVRMTVALGKADMAGAVGHGEAAAAVAEEQGWSHLVVAVQLALGAGYLGAKRLGKGAQRYGEAEKTALTMEQAGDPLGTKLRIQARLGLGAVYVSAGRFGDAAKVYQKAGPLAERLDDHHSALESWRMASYCHEQDRAVQSAWECGLRGLAAGEAMKPDQRQHSTLAYLGEGMMRLSRLPLLVGRGREIDRRMTELLRRADWQPTSPEAH